MSDVQLHKVNGEMGSKPTPPAAAEAPIRLRHIKKEAPDDEIKVCRA